MGTSCMNSSPFVQPSVADQILKNELCYARWDKYPVSRGHMLIVPYREFASYFDATEEESSRYGR